MTQDILNINLDWNKFIPALLDLENFFADNSEGNKTLRIWKKKDWLFLCLEFNPSVRKTRKIKCIGTLNGELTIKWTEIEGLLSTPKHNAILMTYVDEHHVRFNNYLAKAVYQNQENDLFQNQNNKTREELLSLIQKIDLANQKNPPTSREQISIRYERNMKLTSLIKILRGEKCQICGFTFKKIDGGFYSEAHHLENLSNGGFDISKNMLILCANHHRQFHFGNISVVDHTSDYIKIAIDGTMYSCTI